MIAHVKGILFRAGESSVIVEANGIGYSIFVSRNTAAGLPAPGGDVSLLTHMHVREDVMQLYGFLDEDEKELFGELINISKIGPKLALAILSYSPETLKRAIADGDIALISSIPGVGKKTAERLVLELKEKLGLEGYEGGPAAEAGSEAALAREALVSLGFTPAEASTAMRDVDLAGKDSRAIIKECLKGLDRG